MINIKDQYDFCDLVLIDFENTLELDSSVIISEKMLEDIKIDIKSTFDLLLNNIKRSKITTPKPPSAPRKKTSTRSRSPAKSITFSENKKKHISFRLDELDILNNQDKTNKVLNNQKYNLLDDMPEFSCL